MQVDFYQKDYALGGLNREKESTYYTNGASLGINADVEAYA